MEIQGIHGKDNYEISLTLVTWFMLKVNYTRLLEKERLSYEMGSAISFLIYN